jgi:hypothetical protein
MYKINPKIASIIIAVTLVMNIYNSYAIESNQETGSERYHINAIGKIASLVQTQTMSGDTTTFILEGNWILKATAVSGADNEGNAKFFSKFTMVKVDGTMKHTMWLKDLKANTVLYDPSTHYVLITGTIDIWAQHPGEDKHIIPNGDDVPVTIEILEENVIKITVGHPHFLTPIFGTVNHFEA